MSKFYTGIVEDRKDPMQIGRVRVRVHNVHSEDKRKIPTEELPWATVLQPTTSAGISGIGSSPHGLVEGSFVVGFFRDRSLQDFVVLGSVSSLSTVKPDSTIGFFDPNEVYPKYLGRDTNALSRGFETKLKKRLEELEVDLKGKEKTGPFDFEMKPIEIDFKPDYPFDKVLETESGHILELDDTEGHERIRLIHSAGTVIEIGPNGEIFQKGQNSRYTLIVKNDTLQIEGNLNVWIGGNAKLFCKEDVELEVKGGVKGKVHKDFDLEVGGNMSLDVKKKFSVKARNIENEARSSMIIKSGRLSITTGIFNENSGSKTVSTGNLAITASSITHNGTNIGNNHSHSVNIGVGSSAGTYSSSGPS